MAKSDYESLKVHKGLIDLVNAWKGVSGVSMSRFVEMTIIEKLTNNGFLDSKGKIVKNFKL